MDKVDLTSQFLPINKKRTFLQSEEVAYCESIREEKQRFIDTCPKKFKMTNESETLKETLMNASTQISMGKADYECLINDYRSCKEDLYKMFCLLDRPMRKKLVASLSASEFQALTATNPRITSMFINELLLAPITNMKQET